MFEATLRMMNNIPNEVQGEVFCYESYFAFNNLEPDPLYAFKSTSDPDTLYHHQAMKAPDRQDFRDAMDKEIKDQLANGNFTVIRRSNVPPNTKVLPTVWQMRRKRDILTGKVLKDKAWLNIDSSKMTKGVHFDETYTPVANWSTVRLVMTLAAAFQWKTVQIDYVQAFP